MSHVKPTNTLYPRKSHVTHEYGMSPPTLSLSLSHTHTHTHTLLHLFDALIAK